MLLGRVRLNLWVCRVLGGRTRAPLLPTRGHMHPRGATEPLEEEQEGYSDPLCPRCCPSSSPSPQEGPDQATKRGTGAEAHPAFSVGAWKPLGAWVAPPCPFCDRLGIPGRSRPPLPAEPVPGLAPPRGREGVVVAPSLLPSRFRGCRKGPADRARAPGPPPRLHPPFLAQPRLPGWHLDFLPPSPPPQALTLFFFSTSFSTWSLARKMGRGE